jgi:FdhE protein
MNTIAGYNSDYIREAVKDIKRLKPGYDAMLGLYEKIFIAQENSKSSIKLEEFIIPADKLALKLKEEFPLVNIPEFPYDSRVSVDLFTEICTILTAEENELSSSVKQITELIADKKIDIEKLFSSFMNGDETAFDSIEKEHGIDKQLPAYLVFNSLKPSLSVFSQNIAVHLEKDAVWDKGYCPVCGSSPELSLFEENGKRFLICGFCAHKWASKRIYCPFCENSDHETIQYFDIEGEEEYRVDACDKCRKYIKTIDTKKTSRTIYPPLENQSTPYIDLKFEEMGYKPGNA